MKLVLPCFECSGQAILTLERPEYNDSGLHDVTCRRGHRIIALLQDQKFEVLFDLGARAILDGYYREAVSSFTASLERFHEFAVRCLLKRSKISSAKSEEAWKSVSNQSERQLGAFVFVWLTHFGEPPAILTNNDVTFRNAVVHKGRIPTRVEGEIRLAELHWYEANGIGKKELKRKKYLD